MSDAGFKEGLSVKLLSNGAWYYGTLGKKRNTQSRDGILRWPVSFADKVAYIPSTRLQLGAGTVTDAPHEF